MKYLEPLFRPPAEADSLIFQIAYGCPHNSCKFCGMYKTVKYRVRDNQETVAEILAAGRRYPQTRRIFLADGDVMALPFEVLKTYLELLNQAFPRLARVNIYANASSMHNKTTAELQTLRALKLNTLYMGLESGAQTVLDEFGKTESVETMITEVRRVQDLDFKCSVMILIGLGGQDNQSGHIAETITALNRMQPKLLSALRFIQIPGLKMPANYRAVTEYGTVAELRAILANLELAHTVFRANHTSNPLPLSGRFPADKTRLLAELDADLESGLLNQNSAGQVPWVL